MIITYYIVKVNKCINEILNINVNIEGFNDKREKRDGLKTDRISVLQRIGEGNRGIYKKYRFLHCIFLKTCYNEPDNLIGGVFHGTYYQ